MGSFAAELRDVRTLGADTLGLELDTPEGFDGLPGQFLLVRADIDGEEESKHFTIASPDLEDSFEITVEVDLNGTVTPWLAEREIGDEITIDGPYGATAYDDEGDVVTVAEGPGIGPAIAIAERAVARGYDASVIYRSDDPMYGGRLDDLEEAGHGVFLPDENDALAGALAASPDGSTVYVFGFQEFCERVKELVAADGGAGDLHVESFG
jgi:ferredoxin-NADP reductase